MAVSMMRNAAESINSDKEAKASHIAFARKETVTMKSAATKKDR